jgi:epoxyqueuosine reductase QueG
LNNLVLSLQWGPRIWLATFVTDAEYDYIFTTLKGQRCGLCIIACPVGLEALPGQQPQIGGAK